VSFARRLLWCILAIVVWLLSLVVAIVGAIADDCDAVMCWMEHRQ
jgi:hypothetical protein